MSGDLIAQRIAGAGADTFKNLPRGVASAWANLDGTGTIALRDSENVSSVVDRAVGRYTYNISNLFADGEYAPLVSGRNSFTTTTYFGAGIDADGVPSGLAVTESHVQIRLVGSNGAYADSDLLLIASFGDLA